MVILHIERNDKKNEFLWETTVSQKVEDLVTELTEVHNLRLKCLRLAVTVRELAKHGPIRPEETRGLSQESSKLSELDVNAYGKPSNPDEHGYRTGCPPPQATADVLLKTADEVETSVSHTLVAQKRCVDAKVCQEGLDNLYGAVMIAYPAFHRLPAYDPTRMELENREELDGQSEMQDVLEADNAVLWWAGKELLKGKLLSDYVGKNEKTKIQAKLVPKGAGAPVRESRIDEATHKAMMSFYYKKQEEAKKLAADEDDSYLESEWANPKALKSALIGGGRGISAPGIGRS